MVKFYHGPDGGMGPADLKPANRAELKAHRPLNSNPRIAPPVITDFVANDVTVAQDVDVTLTATIVGSWDYAVFSFLIDGGLPFPPILALEITPASPSGVLQFEQDGLVTVILKVFSQGGVTQLRKDDYITVFTA